MRLQWLIPAVCVCLLGVACVPQSAGNLSTPTATTSPSPAVTATPTALPPTATPAATLPLPTDTPTPTAEVTATPTSVPPRPGSFDVYLGRRNDDGLQELVWLDVRTGEMVTRVLIHTDDGYAIRAGQYIYYHAFGTRLPQRVNTAGAIESLEFAHPPAGAGYYQLLPSANGRWLAWISVDAAGTTYRISMSSADGHDARVVAEGELESGTAVQLIRLANDGRMLFFALQPENVTGRTLFNARYDLYALDTATGTATHLPGEPACGENLACDAHISPDGAYLARTLPPGRAAAPVIVTNLVSNTVIARFEPQGIPYGATFEIGYPYFTPGGELVYTEAVGSRGLERYLLVFANIVTGEQHVITDLGGNRHRPLGWTGDGYVLLTTREPGLYDTWQIDIRNGSVRQIAALLFLGHIEEPAPDGR